MSIYIHTVLGKSQRTCQRTASFFLFGFFHESCQFFFFFFFFLRFFWNNLEPDNSLILEYLMKEPRVDGSLKIERIESTYTHTHTHTLTLVESQAFCKSLTNKAQKGVCHTWALPFTLKSILRQKENYVNYSIISPCKNIIFKKNLL